MDKIPTYPARPINGGPLEKARPKHGVWACEPKVNGWRALVHVASGEMWNRHGEKLSIASEFKPALNQLRSTLDAQAFEWADCEALERRHGIGRGTLIVLDVIPTRAFAATPYSKRRIWLQAVLPHLSVPPLCCQADSLYLIPSAVSGAAANYYAMLQKQNAEARCEFYEGIVMKRVTAPYPAQLIKPTRETTDWVKHRWHF